MLLNFYFTGQNALVILIVAGQQGGGIQIIFLQLVLMIILV